MQTNINTLAPYLTRKQLEAAVKAANVDKRGIIWWKIGEGKTRVALAWMLLIQENPRPLIICSPGAFRQWLDEIKLIGLSKIVKPQFLSTGLLSRRNTLVIDFAKVNCIVADELWMFKNPKSNRSIHLAQITNRLPSIGLSGSLMTAGNVEDLYGQAKAMNLDRKLANTLTSFRNQFEIETLNWAGFLQRSPRKGAVEAIQRRLIDNVDVYFPKQSMELRDIPVNVEPSNEQIEIRTKLVKTWMYENEGEVLDIKNATTLVIKLQQVSDGFIRMSQGNYVSIQSNKMQRLKELCSELFDAGERILVWVGFKKTAHALSESLPFKTTLLTGEGNFDVYAWREGKVKATIATVSSGASLNDFAQVKYSIFYSTNFSTLHVQQAKGRTNRKSSLQNCSYYYFLSTSSFPDASIYKKIEDNKSKEQIVIETCQQILANEKKTRAIQVRQRLGIADPKSSR